MNKKYFQISEFPLFFEMVHFSVFFPVEGCYALSSTRWRIAGEPGTGEPVFIHGVKRAYPTWNRDSQPSMEINGKAF